MKHTPYRLASHLRFTVYAGAGRLVNMPESTCGYADGIEKTDHSAHRVVRDRRRLLRQRRDTRLLDLAHPTLTERLDLGPGQVGLALMALAAGALVAFPITGRLVDTRSSAFTVVLLRTGHDPVVALRRCRPAAAGLIVALFVVGFGNGGMDVSMNAQGIQVERFVGRSIINSLHGCFSLGAFTGAAIGAGVAQLGVPPLVHFLGVSVFGLAALGGSAAG